MAQWCVLGVDIIEARRVCSVYSVRCGGMCRVQGLNDVEGVVLHYDNTYIFKDTTALSFSISSSLLFCAWQLAFSD